ncbi:putative sulfite reductase [NADPH] flavoprotein component [Neolecta irregularis DAH-3]|uniref:assimilatory sulfite reductase (NADPH) n=1 Tax=Neolecta irregularis (strain DAH-3) TaxID=1198029 RepID=A0A1U7LUP1_NEOID|nr:putative sulfite reductase [NADPH] flavoprotein component [Neolecta irregularis DAH-3]|eukprot:OLL26262.1 putative sulfite reductase [NADPH] flavoprotein component [Neolecta irregularis DAH-3]
MSSTLSELSEYTVQDLIEQIAFVLSYSVYSYADTIPYIGRHLAQLSRDQPELSSRIFCLQSRAGAASIILGEFSQTPGSCRQPRAIISTVQSLDYMRSTLSKNLAGMTSPLVFNVAAIDFDLEMNPQINYIPALEFARENNLGLVTSRFAEEVQHMSIFATLSALYRPTAHVYDGLILAKETRIYLDSGSVYTAYKSILEDLRTNSFKSPEEPSKVILHKVNLAFGTNYAPFEYYGSPLVSKVLVVFGSVEYRVAREYIDSSDSVGLINVRVFRPFYEDELLTAIPSTAKRIDVLGQVSKAGEVSDNYFHSILYQDIIAAIYDSNRFSPLPRARDFKYLPCMKWTVSQLSQIVEEDHSPSRTVGDVHWCFTSSVASEDVSTSSSVSTLPTDIDPGTSLSNMGYEPLEPVTTMSSWNSAAQALCFKEAFNYQLKLRPDLAEHTYVVRVQENKRLTPKSYDRNIFHIEFDISGTSMNYEIGEALGIHGQNDPTEACDFLEFYGLKGNEIIELPSRDDTEVFESRTTLQVAMQNIDLFGKPLKRFYRELADYATDEAEKRKLSILASAEGAVLFKHRSDVEMVTYVDILREFESARPPFQELIKMISPLKRREYSIASSQKVHPTSVHLLVVVVNWQDPWERTRFGHCTRYLSNLQPILMAGLGTGLAPFRAFVEHRAWQKQQGIAIGKVFLYLGSRHQREEYLYGDEFEAYENAGIITLLGKAFSRDQPHKVYIQDIMRNTLPEIVDAFIVENGSFYLCGPIWPVPDVTQVLEDAVIMHSKSMKAEKVPNTKKIIEQLKDDSRYVLEVY